MNHYKFYVYLVIIDKCLDGLVETFSKFVTFVTIDMEESGNGKITGVHTNKLIIY